MELVTLANVFAVLTCKTLLPVVQGRVVQSWVKITWG